MIYLQILSLIFYFNFAFCWCLVYFSLHVEVWKLNERNQKKCLIDSLFVDLFNFYIWPDVLEKHALKYGEICEINYKKKF